jgi:hypothetical protein
MAEFTAVGDAIHNDFFVVTGSGFADDLQLLFETAAGTVTVVPDVVRPQMGFVARLPASVPTGGHWLRLRHGGTTTGRIPVEVTAQPPYTVRVLYSGKPKAYPYTIAFVANPAIESQAGGTFNADPVLTNRAGYHNAVAYCLQNILRETEDVLRAGDIDAQMRFVSVFDATLAAQYENALARELSPNVMETRRGFLASFLARFREVADMVFVLHGSTTHTRASAWFTTDDNSRPTLSFTYDGVSRKHGRFSSIPGSCTIPITNTIAMTALHEFGHAASDFNNGRVVDLYVDGTPGGFMVNKKFRARATDPVPANFATYNGTNFNADPNRDALGYPAAGPMPWISYHPQLIDATRPNLMDNYFFSFDTPRRCRLDQLTYAWMRDRLLAKLGR